MLTVKTIADHFNAYGAAYAKAVGDEYQVPAAEAAVLVDAGLIEVLGETLADDAAPKDPALGADASEAGE